MKAIILILSFLLFFHLSPIHGQALRFVTRGTIEYTKTVNMYALLKKVLLGTRDQQLYDEYKRAQPQFRVMNSKLSFFNNTSLFEPAADDIKPYHMFVAQNNIVFTDLSTKQIVSQKDLLGEAYLLKDKSRPIRWKITDETRDILGYPCRRANAVIMDSIYVVAFFTADIPVSAGPELFNGLPGMILQVSLPRENITWLATKVTDISTSVLTPPVKGKPTTHQQLLPIVQSALQRYGENRYMLLKALLL